MVDKKLLVIVFSVIIVTVGFSNTLTRNGALFSYPFEIVPVHYQKVTVHKILDPFTLEVIADGELVKLKMIGIAYAQNAFEESGKHFDLRKALNFTRAMCYRGSEVYLTYGIKRYDNNGALLSYIWYRTPGGIWVMHNLSLITNLKAPYTGYFHLDDTWITEFNEADRRYRENTFETLL